MLEVDQSLPVLWGNTRRITWPPMSARLICGSRKATQHGQLTPERRHRSARSKLARLDSEIRCYGGSRPRAYRIAKPWPQRFELQRIYGGAVISTAGVQLHRHRATHP